MNSQEKPLHKYSSQVMQKEGMLDITIPQLLQLHILRNERAKLIDSSTILFGRKCLRLVNIAFQTSKMFPSLMGTCHTVTEYLQKELKQRDSKEHFHIVIAENNGFSFAIDNYSHFADIKQEQYRILIFSTKSHEKVKMDAHDVNNQMKLKWKSIVLRKMIN